MTEIISVPVESEDLKESKEKTGLSLSDCIKILVNSVKYGGKLEFDIFWSEKNMQHLAKSIDDMNHGRNLVKFTDEEWEKFVNEQDIL